MRRNSEYTLYDGIGSVTKLTDGSGTPSEQITFDAFGRQVNIGGTSSDPYQYKSEYGYRTDGDGAYDQGIMKVGARYYDPLFGRFITRDTDLSQKEVGTTLFSDATFSMVSPNYAPYSYCNGDPVDYVDPQGHKIKKIHIIIDGIGLVVGAVLGSPGGFGGAFVGGVVGLGVAEVGYQLVSYGNLNHLFSD